jgi:hypothetical protein
VAREFRETTLGLLPEIGSRDIYYQQVMGRGHDHHSILPNFLGWTLQKFFHRNPDVSVDEPIIG